MMHSQVTKVFESYPDAPRAELLNIRAAIFAVAQEESLGEIVETLKWGEPSYQSKHGSPIRIGWKAKSPHTISVYFNCKTTLIETFKEIYHHTFQFEGNREIVLHLSDDIAMAQLKACLSMALRYHQIKHLPLLGA